VSALAADREIVPARGEMVEIGDGFRIPELLESTDARLTGMGVPVIADIGSGLLAPHPALPEEPDAVSACMS
jgi:L-seryl-tRNA(Ser) seleniumtransferase